MPYLASAEEERAWRGEAVHLGAAVLPRLWGQRGSRRNRARRNRGRRTCLRQPVAAAHRAAATTQVHRVALHVGDGDRRRLADVVLPRRVHGHHDRLAGTRRDGELALADHVAVGVGDREGRAHELELRRLGRLRGFPTATASAAGVHGAVQRGAHLLLRGVTGQGVLLVARGAAVVLHALLLQLVTLLAHLLDARENLLRVATDRLGELADLLRAERGVDATVLAHDVELLFLGAELQVAVAGQLRGSMQHRRGSLGATELRVGRHGHGAAEHALDRGVGVLLGLVLPGLRAADVAEVRAVGG